MEYEIGQMVYSKCGHDAGQPFIITAVEENFLWLADGKCRSLAKPKRKKKKHVQVTGYKSEELAQKLQNGSYVLDAHLARFLKETVGNGK